MKKALFLRFSLTSLLITLSLEKESIVLVKSLEKVLNFGSKICTHPDLDICLSFIPQTKKTIDLPVVVKTFCGAE